MFGLVIVAHAPLGYAFYQCLEHVYGSLEECVYLDIQPDQTAEEVGKVFSKVCKDILQMPERLIVFDLFGASPANSVFAFLKAQPERITQSTVCLSGGNLPLLIKAYGVRNLELSLAVPAILATSTKGTQVFNAQGQPITESNL